MDALFQIVTMLIPKAGIQLGGVPLTLSALLFLLVIVRNPNQTILAIQQKYWIGVLYAVLFCFGICSFVFGIVSNLPVFVLAQIVTVVSSPLAGVIAFRMSPEKSMKIVCIALILVDMYAAAQFTVGIMQISVPGISYTLGQNLESKPIGFGHSQEASALKMPSTYQNGNYLGLFGTLGLSLALIWKPRERFWAVVRFLAIGSGILGIILCGSRSIVLPVLLVSLLLVVERYKATRHDFKPTFMIGTLSAALATVSYVVIFHSSWINQFSDRIFYQTVNDPTAAGRTSQWRAMAETIMQLPPAQLIRLVLLGQGNYGLIGEGLPTFFATFGLMSTVAFYGMPIASIVYLWKNHTTRTVAYGVFCALFAFTVDSSFYYPPNVMILFMVISIAFVYARTTSLREISKIL